MRRITVSMLKAKNPSEAMNEIIDEWFEKCVKEGMNNGKFDYYLNQVGASLFYPDISSDARIKIIIYNVLDKIALTLFTPRAWQEIVDEIEEYYKENYYLKNKKKRS